MKHAATVHFRFSRPLTLLGLLMLIAANGGAGKTAAERPKTLGSLLQQMRGKPSQRKQSDIGKGVPSAPLFLEAPQYATALFPFSVAVADFNGDGKDDLAVVNVCGDSGSCADTDPLAGSLAFTRSSGLAATSRKRRHNEGVASPLDTKRLFVRGKDLGQGFNTALLLDAYGNYPRGVKLNESLHVHCGLT